MDREDVSSVFCGPDWTHQSVAAQELLEAWDRPCLCPRAPCGRVCVCRNVDKVSFGTQLILSTTTRQASEAYFFPLQAT